MSNVSKNEMLVGVDIGTSKIVAIVAETRGDGLIEIIGLGTFPSKGLKNGVVVDIESTTQAIKKSIAEAESMAGCHIGSCYVGISGSHIRGLNSEGVVPIRDGEVRYGDVDRVIETAQAMAIPADQKLLHVLPRDYIIDKQDGIKEPLGMAGSRLEAKVHLVTCSENSSQNIHKCISASGLDVESFVLEQIASSYSVLTSDERDLGVCLIDIGGGTTDVAVFVDGSISFTDVIPIAGDQVTNDISVAFRTPNQSAEDIKINHGSAITKMASANEIIEIPLVDGRDPKKITTLSLSQVIQPRMEELFDLIKNELIRSKTMDAISSGIVITGGSSMLNGAVDLAESIFGVPVRLGLPRDIDGLLEVIENPRYATGVGLLKMGKEDKEKDTNLHLDGNTITNILKKMKLWFQGNF